MFVFTACLLHIIAHCQTGIIQRDARRPDLGFDTRIRYDSALANHVETLNILVASKMGRNPEAIAAFEAAGGKVGYRSDPVGYFWGNLPTSELPKLLAVQYIVDIELDGPTNSGIDYNKPSDLGTLKPNSVWNRQKALKSVDDGIAKLPLLAPADLEGVNPYLPWHLIGVPEYLKEHPTYDGRGTTIAVVEGYGDLLHPVLQDALTLDGRHIPKIAGILDISSDEEAFYDRGRGYYPAALILKMEGEIAAESRSVEYQATVLTLPAPGRYRIARLENGGRAFWVLWSQEKGSVWVDTNQNHNFADEVELKDINQEFSAAEIPAEHGLPNESLASATPFSIAIDKDRSEIKFFLNLDHHGTGVASIAAGSGFLGGKGNGVAPGARLLFVTRGSGSLHDDLKAFIAAASRSDVDVITCSFVIKPMISGETVTALILDRLAQVYQKPMFFTVTAGPFATTDNISDQGTGEHVFGIMGYTTPEVWNAFYGVKVPLRDNDPDGGGDGPAISGALKPDFVTPFHQLAAGNCAPDSYEAEHRSAFIGAAYRLPRCYVQFGGTSGSTPEAAGLAALLISGAKQAGKNHDLYRLTWALHSSAKYLDQTYEAVGYQGYGLPNVAAAWRLLSSDELTPVFEIFSESNGPHESYRRTPNVGVGVYEYANWHPGMSGEREVTITRQSGGKEANRYQLSWRGNDGTFAAPGEIDLPLNQPVKIAIKFALKENGIHQAILQIVDPASGNTLRSFLNTVVASQPLGSDAPMAAWQASVPLSHDACSMFDVQANIHALAVDIGVQGGPAGWWAGPSASRGEQTFLSSYLPNQDIRSDMFKKAGSQRVLFRDPAPGVWAFCIRNHQGAGDPQANHVAYVQAGIKLTALQVDVKLDKIHVQKDISDDSTLRAEIAVANRESPLKGAVVKTQIGFEEEHTIEIPAAGGTAELDWKVAAGIQKLLLNFRAGKTNAKLAASVYACSTDVHKNGQMHCALQDYQENPGLLKYNMPQAGQWKVLLYQLGAPVEAKTNSVQIGVIQTPNGGGLEAQIGNLDTNARATKSIDLKFPTAMGSGRPVLLTEVYDSAQDEGEEATLKLLPKTDREKMLPIVLGQAIQAIPRAPEHGK
ncbi:MAG: S8 family serine peptidase [Edaphobacter sp.]